MVITDQLEVLFDKYNFELSRNVKQGIEFNLQHNTSVNKHFAFIIDGKTRRVICYDCNIFFKSTSFPISQHAEVKVICKYYQKMKTIPRGKKYLIVVKISKTGIISNSRCCMNCVRFLFNNFDNLHLKKVYYSTNGTTLEQLSKDDLIESHFVRSKGFSSRIAVRK